MNSKRWSAAATLFLGAALVVGPADAVGQDAVIGIKGGIDSYDLSWSPDEIAPSIGHKTGFVGGLFGGVTFTNVIGVQLEALYSQRNVVEQDDDVNLKLAYFEIPLLLTAKFSVADTPMRPILFAGPSMSFESKCDLSGEDAGVSVSIDCDDPEVDLSRKTTAWALVFGAGIDYPVGNFVLGGEWRYNLGLTNFNDDEGTSSDETVKWKGWSIMFTVGYPI